MDKATRNAIERATQRARKLLEVDFAAQLEGTFYVLPSGTVAPKAGSHLSLRQIFHRDKIVAAIDHKRAASMSAADAVADYLRDAAFTALNRFVALKMLEARELAQECITKGEQSAGYREFCGLASGVPLLPESSGYRLYIECLFDEMSTEVKVLFDRRDTASVLWPRRATFEALLEVLNSADLSGIWSEDETIGWVYQFFNSKEERAEMRDPKRGGSQAPRNSRELAVRNQFFTPRYVVQFLADNTLGRLWFEMCAGQTALVDRYRYLVRKAVETSATRQKKDPRDIRVLDPACGSGHFLLYTFDLLLAIYEDAYRDADGPASETTGKTLAIDFPSIDALRRAMPALILANNLHGVDIDPRCAQIAQLALWMRAQRAFRDFGIERAVRPIIRRSNIVVAEPLVSDARTLTDFLEKLGDADLSNVFTDLVEMLKLAGDLGLLLRVETLIAHGHGRGQAGALFAPPEPRIRAAISAFVATSDAFATTRRRLFVDDAAQGIGLLEISEKRFDVILMNPPFGLPTPKSKEVLQSLYPETWKDLYAAFAERGLSLLSSSGLLGIISPTTWLYSRQLREFRRLLLEAGSPHVFAELGGGVMDDATVEAALWCATLSRRRMAGMYLDLLAQPPDNREVLLASSNENWRALDPRSFVVIDGAPLCHHLPSAVLDMWRATSRRLDPDVAEVVIGNKTFNDFRFLRLWWEVHSQDLGSTWRTYRAGGDYQPFASASVLVANCRDFGRENRCFGETRHGSDAQVMQSSKHWFEPGLSYPRVGTAGLGIRVARAGEVFSHSAVFIRVGSVEDRWSVLALLNSPIAMRLYEAHGRNRLTETIAIKDLPFAEDWQVTLRQPLRPLAQRAWVCANAADVSDETQRLFQGIPASPDNGEDVGRFVTDTKRNLRLVLDEIDSCVRSVLRVGPSIEGWNDADNWGWRINSEEYCSRLLSYLIGVAFTRFRRPLLSGCSAWLCDSGKAFEALPTLSPAMDGTASNGRDARIEVCLSDDQGTSKDLPERILAAAREVGGAALAGRLDALAATAFGSKADVRSWLSQRYFDWHLRKYSAMARKAPIYWQLATPSASYSVWMYIHALTKDTLFLIQNEFVAPKLAHEERRLNSLNEEARESSNATARKVISTQEAFVTELRAFLEEVKRVAPLWNPNLDDGVTINFAPLWRLVPHHQSWQKELMTTWDQLCAGDYDWAHLAMHLWPQRVVPKCALDRSLAIAHGLDGVFWVEASDGKWKARPSPTRSIEELIGERHSSAIEVALKSMLDAPTVSGAGRLRSRRTGSVPVTEDGDR